MFVGEQTAVLGWRLRRWDRVLALTILTSLLVTAGMYWQGERSRGPGQAVPVLEEEIIPTVSSRHAAYNTVPPTSGPHVSYIAQWGVYREPLPPEVQVGNLAAGGVLVQYQPAALSAPAIQALEQVIDDYRSGVIVAPNPNLRQPLALTAWGRIQTLDAVDVETIRTFIDAYRDAYRGRD